jgi:aldose 1-epimerase
VAGGARDRAEVGPHHGSADHRTGRSVHTGNFLDGKVKGKGGAVYRQHAGFCLEAQHFPDAVHHKNFPSIILEPGKTYTQTTIYHFSAK